MKLRIQFAALGGDTAQGWLILKNDSCTLGLFKGMIEKNTLTFNPGWDQNAQPLDSFQDIRALQSDLRANGMDFVSEADETGTGPANFIVQDPDGNPVLVDQHVDRPGG